VPCGYTASIAILTCTLMLMAILLSRKPEIGDRKLVALPGKSCDGIAAFAPSLEAALQRADTGDAVTA
jgi:hypothetical protein